MIKIIFLIALWAVKAFLTFLAARDLNQSLHLEVTEGRDIPRDAGGFLLFLFALWGVDVIVFIWGLPW